MLRPLVLERGRWGPVDIANGVIRDLDLVFLFGIIIFAAFIVSHMIICFSGYTA